MPRESTPPEPRSVCFVTGTRAEYGLMRSTLDAIAAHPRLSLQIVVTGQHFNASRGSTWRDVVRDGWPIDARVPWKASGEPTVIARETGRATARLAEAFERLRTDVVLVVGDRVEAFAAAGAATIGGRLLAHVHGGDRALGQVDDSLRHAISKLAHVHFPATRESGERLFAMGEDRRRIHVVGAPGIDAIRKATATLPDGLLANRFVLLLMHPETADADREATNARRLIDAVARASELPIVALFPNGDAGAAGIVEAIHEAGDRVRLIDHAPRDAFLAMLRDARALVGNSSSGIIEAGAFGTPVVDVGVRQLGRERGPNVLSAAWSDASLRRAIARAIAARRTAPREHPYWRGGAGRRIAATLASLPASIRGKIIRY